MSSWGADGNTGAVQLLGQRAVRISWTTSFFPRAADARDRDESAEGERDVMFFEIVLRAPLIVSANSFGRAPFPLAPYSGRGVGVRGLGRRTLRPPHPDPSPPSTGRGEQDRGGCRNRNRLLPLKYCPVSEFLAL